MHKNPPSSDFLTKKGALSYEQTFLTYEKIRSHHKIVHPKKGEDRA